MKTKSYTFRTIAIWTLISMVLQFGVYFLLNNAIEKVMNPQMGTTATTLAAQSAATPTTVTVNAVLPDLSLYNVQISYDKNYLAYMVDGVFKVFDIKNNKVVFTKAPDSGSGKNMGVLNYQWLADRNSLIYFFAKMATVTTTTSSDTDNARVSAKASSTPYNAEDPNATPEITSTPEPTETPASTKKTSTSKTTTSTQQVTELNTLDLTDNDSSTPDDRHYINLNSFPAGGQISQIASSTYTNLIYIDVKTGTTEKLMEIDVMNNSKFLQLSGETITNIVTSDRYGTLYLESKSGNTKQIIALNGTKRKTVSKNANYIILGGKSGVIYFGEVSNDKLTKILSGTESSDNTKTLELSQIWEGEIPYKDMSAIIGSSGQVIIYGDKTAYVVYDGKENTVSFTGEKNYVSSDGAEQIQLTRSGYQTKLALNPLSIS